MKTLVSNSDINNLVRIRKIIDNFIISPEYNAIENISMSLYYDKMKGYLIGLRIVNSEDRDILINSSCDENIIIGTLKLHFSKTVKTCE
jgi:hypothetical protein